MAADPWNGQRDGSRCADRGHWSFLRFFFGKIEKNRENRVLRRQLPAGAEEWSTSWALRRRLRSVGVVAAAGVESLTAPPRPWPPAPRPRSGVLSSAPPVAIPQIVNLQNGNSNKIAWTNGRLRQTNQVYVMVRDKR